LSVFNSLTKNYTKIILPANV